MSGGNVEGFDVLEKYEKSYTIPYKNCKSCQVNIRKKQKFGKLPTKQVIKTPWEYLCVDLIGPYTLRGKDKSEINFMCLTMIDLASSWFEIVELPVADHVPTEPVKKTEKLRRHTLINPHSLLVT